jgi:hypothetical protein
MNKVILILFLIAIALTVRAAFHLPHDDYNNPKRPYVAGCP